MALSVGDVIADRYRIEGELGRGAMGIVHRARHIKLNRAFAIKVLHPQLTANEKLRRRFQREAETASTLRHKNLVGVVDIGETAQLVYLVMELADGLPLSDIMVQAPLSSRRVIEYVRQLCDGLQAAHDAKLIHRDFKPDNVIVERTSAGETLRIIDFGIAVLRDAAAEDRERLTTEGIVLGTPHYMAPEHASGDPVDHRIDLFALGVIMFEMMTGVMPFEGDGVEVARANMMYDTPMMSARVPFLEVDPLLEALTRKLMARDRDKRISSAKQARELLDLIVSDRLAAAVELGLAAASLPEPPPPPTTAERSRLAMPVLSTTDHVRVRAAPNTLEPVVSTLPTEAIQAPRRRLRAAMLGGAVAVAMIGVVLAAGSRDNEQQLIAADLPATTERIVVMQADPPAPPPVPALVPAPIPGPAPTTVIVPAKPIAPILKKVTAPAPPLRGELPAPDPTAKLVAELYGAVGRQLGHLQQSKGSDATIDLWPRFRHIRINDAISTPDSRRDTKHQLEQLQHDVEARR